MGPSGQGWEHGEEFFGYLFHSKKTRSGTATGLPPPSKRVVRREMIFLLRYLLLHAQRESYSREKVGHMNSEGLVAPLMPTALPKAF